MSGDRVIVIGGGFAGLAAAQSLVDAGLPVTLLEKKPHLGGRAYSFVDRTTGDEVDNGQHILMGCYTETLRYLEEIGAADKLFVQDSLRVDFIDEKGRPSALQCPPFPAPIHLLLGILRMTSLSLRDRLSTLLLGKGMLGSPPDAHVTADAWLASLGQTEGVRRKLWDIVTVATLNRTAGQASARLLHRVIREAFLKGPGESRIVISRVGLSSLYADDARRAIEASGGEVLLDAGVKEIIARDGRASAVRTSNGDVLPVRAIISSVPPADLRMIPGAPPVPDLETSPILSVFLWLDRPVLRRPFVALQGTETQWIFDKDRLYHREGRPGHYLSFIVSDARELMDLPRSEIVGRVIRDLHRVIPPSRNARVIHSVVVRERHATMAQTPENVALRPGPRTPLSRFFLAGDWTDTGLPATIEGAVRSGREAAKRVMRL